MNTEEPSLRKIRQGTIITMDSLIRQGILQVTGPRVTLTEAVLNGLDPERIRPPD